MKTNVYYLKKKLVIGEESFSKGTPLVVSFNDERYSIEGKEMGMVFDEKTFRSYFESGAATLEDDDVYVMVYSSGYREYVAIGRDFTKMAKHIVNRYNYFCDTSDKMTLKKFAKDEEAMFHTYRMKLDTMAFDTEYLDNFDDSAYVGDFLNQYRKKENRSDRFFSRSSTNKPVW